MAQLRCRPTSQGRAACSRLSAVPNEAPMLQHRIYRACSFMARCVLSAYNFRRFEIKKSKRFRSTDTNLRNADSAAISATVDYSSRPIATRS
jgi:hypothetical protein